MDVFDVMGALIYAALGVCSLIAVYVMSERLFALRESCVLPEKYGEAFASGAMDHLTGDRETVAGRVVLFFRMNQPEPDALKAFATLEVARMEKGMFLLESVISAAPLLGLLGTVVGLCSIFAGIDPESALPRPGTFVEGFALALITTIMGLAIAIPALIANNYLLRRIDLYAARLGVGVERLIDAACKPAQS